MRNYVASLLILISLIVIVVPVLLVRGCTPEGDEGQTSPDGSVIKVFNHVSHKVQKMELEEYLKGVVAAEMPVSFEPEALKAQAVLARTYVVRRMLKGINVPEHPEAVISTDFQNGQAWVSKQELKKRWGLLYMFNWNKISHAVEATRGELLTYRGQLIEALYHANAGGRTEDAVNVWGNSIPYLKSVDSPYDKESSKFRQEFTYSYGELDRRLHTNLVHTVNQKGLWKSVSKTSLKQLIQVLQYSSGGRILQVRVGTRVFPGKDFRALLALPTTRCSILPVQGGVKIVTYGNGHGVGMSQYGANGMAKRGSTYRDVLHHYYPGALIGRLK